MKTFKDSVAVITGAASGLGREFANVAARHGMKLVLADVQGDALERSVEELKSAGAQVLGVLCDVRKAEQVQALADAAMQSFGGVHLVFNNAGVGSGGLVWENTEADWEWVLGVNLWGVIHGVRIFTQLMLAQAAKDTAFEGHIVNTASMAGLLNAPVMGAYNVSKHAVVSLSETLYHDLQLVGAPIGASVLCPYFVPTGISQSHRNRPEDVKMTQGPTPSQLVAQAMTDKAVNSGKVSAPQVAQITFDAIAAGQFYIYSHPGALQNVQERMEEIVHARNPADPHKATPQLSEMLRAKMRAAATPRSRPVIRYGQWDELQAECKAIRFEVFVNEQQVPAEIELDEMDALCLHALAYDAKGTPVGTGRLLPDGHIGRMAVRKQARGSGVGGALLKGLMEKARERGDTLVALSAQTHAAPFYARYGFVKDGEEFTEAGIPHINMQRVLA